MSYFKKHNKFILIFLGILLILSVLIGISYAYYMVTASQTNKNHLASSCISISLTNEKNDITLNNAYPITNSEGKKLTPYQFTITNTCNIFISYNVNLEMLEGTDLSTDYIKTMVNSEAPYILSSLDSASTTIDKSTESRTLAQGSLGSNDSVDYALRLWMDENTPLNNDTQDKSLISKIVVVAQPSTYKPSDYVTTLHDAILVNEYGVKNVDNAKNKIKNKTSPNFNQTAPIITWNETTDETTTSQVIKPTVDSIKSISEFSVFSEDEYLMRICTKKEFDSSTANYKLSNCSFLDPTTLDYSGDNEYYYVTEYVSYNYENKKFQINYLYGEKKIYKILSATKKNITTTTNEINYNAIEYNLSTIRLTEEQIESDKSDKGLYITSDNYGDTYYYRGNIENNNVYFAGMYWQIIRINGDNSIRIMYNGTVKNAIGAEKTINSTLYDFNSLYNGPTYVGYMYGDANGSTYAEDHKNSTSSNIKNVIDNWYKSNISNTNNENYIETNSTFCGDRSLYVGNGILNTEASYFGAYGRYMNSTASLTCKNKNDIYTVKGSEKGNNSLTYPVGLITYDELAISGVIPEYSNPLAWTYSSSAYWTMSPAYFMPSNGYAHGWIQADNGMLVDTFVIQRAGIRPVINLKADVEISGGIGTVNDPYVIKTN